MNTMTLHGWLYKKPGKRTVQLGLYLTLFFQLSVLSVEYLGSVLPIWTGEAIVLKTEPVDPRSLFRGNFVRLNYEINRVTVEGGGKDYKEGEVIFVTLIEKQGIWQAETIDIKRPEHGSYIRGRIRSIDSGSVRVEYGIEAFFMPKEKALKVQDEMRGHALVRVYVAPDGKARAVGFKCLGEACG
ncbi:GDYXXLXY domain-containing protein [uncultured Shewanella sp.]|uniref:GDYXXLXY domain-containing protein n=1 Tax=Shewanella atlantica TaxID=271099 RepID=UPI002633E641|nr:GDYXXLXY domain-containing protein [uncultured Shewanella sp.]